MENTATTSSGESSSFLSKNEFLLRRLHSLSGLVPVGAYMVVHLLTNSTVLESPDTFQRAVYNIHSLPGLLAIEWIFIFIPLLFHAIYGVVIVRSGLPNNSSYRYTNNVRYTMQRATGMIAFAFIFWHVFHMHGWFHFDWWENMAHELKGAQFKPYNATSTASDAIQMSMPLVPILYAIGVLSCVFHLANGIWTFGLTWGLWITPRAQARATQVCTVFGVLLAMVGMGALGGFAGKSKADIEKARVVEEKMLKAKIAAGDVDPHSPKIAHPHVTKPMTAAKEPADEGQSAEPKTEQ